MEKSITTTFIKSHIVNFMVKLLVTFAVGGFLSACTSSALVVPSANYPVERLGIYEAKVHALSEIPTEILGEIDKMGVDNSSYLNEHEANFLGFVYGIKPQVLSLIGKKVGFLSNKADYFRYTRNQANLVGGSAMYVFNAKQKAESGGYDAAVVYWRKFLLRPEWVVKRLKAKKGD